MKTLNVQISTILILILTLQNSISTSHSNPNSPSIQCLFQKNIQISCVRALDIPTLSEQDPQFATYTCPILMDLLAKKLNSGVDSSEDTKEIEEKAKSVCIIGSERDLFCGYLLFGVQMIRGEVVRALEDQYRLFFRSPFGHQEKFREILDKYRGYFDNKHIISADDKTQASLVERAIYLFYSNQLKQSLKILQQLPSSKTMSNKSLYPKLLQLRIMQKNGQFPEALTMVSELLKKSTGKIHWYFFHLRGNLLMHHLKFREAIQSFEQALLLKMEQDKSYFGFTLYNIGLCYQKIGEFAKSVQYFKGVLGMGEDTVEALNSIGFTYYSLMQQSNSTKHKNSNQKHSQKYFRKAIYTNKDYYISYYNLGILKYQTHNYKQSLQLLQTALKKSNNNTNTSIKYAIFKTLYHLDQKQAQLFLEKQILRNATADGDGDGEGEGEGNLFFDVAVLYYQIGGKRKALGFLDKAGEGKYNLGQVFQWKGIIQYEMEMYRQAQDSFKKALQYGNTKATIWYNLGYIQFLEGNLQRALGLLKKSHQLDPEGPAQVQIQEVEKQIKSKQSAEL